MPDRFAYRTRRPSDPPVSIFDITPDDGAELSRTTLALNVATAGTLHVTMIDGSEGSLSIAPGAAVALQVRKVWATGTTATGIRGLA